MSYRIQSAALEQVTNSQSLDAAIDARQGHQGADHRLWYRTPRCQNKSLTLLIAGWLRFFTLIQFGDTMCGCRDAPRHEGAPFNPATWYRQVLVAAF
jgi:hypothetical protein